MTNPGQSGETVPHQDFGVYEVFAQTQPLGAMEWQASLMAGSPQMALSLAQQNFLRRRQIYGLWVVPRDAIAKAPTDPTDPSHAADALFRLPKGYRELSDYHYLVSKWRQYQQQAMTPDTMA